MFWSFLILSEAHAVFDTDSVFLKVYLKDHQVDFWWFQSSAISEIKFFDAISFEICLINSFYASNKVFIIISIPRLNISPLLLLLIFFFLMSSLTQKPKSNSIIKSPSQNFLNIIRKEWNILTLNGDNLRNICIWIT